MQLFTLTGRIATPDNVPVQGCVVRAFMLPTRVILEDTGIAQTVKTKTDAGGQFTLRLIKAEGVRYSIQTEAPERLPSGLVVDPWTLPGDTASLADLTTAAPGPLPPLQLGLTEDEKTRLQAIPPAVDSLDSRVTALEGDSDALTVVSTGPVDLDDAAPVGTMRGFVVTADGVLIEGTTTTAGTWVAVKEAAASGDASGWVLYQAGAGGGGSTGVADTTPPSAIAGLTAAATDATTVTASWSASTDAESAVTYRARITPSGGAAGAWRTVTGTTTTFTGLSGGTAHTVEVYATSAGGQSAVASASATTPAPLISSPLDLGAHWIFADATDASTVTYSSGAIVSALADKSGNGNTLTQSDPAKRPTRSTLADGVASLEFSGVVGNMLRADPSPDQGVPLTLWVAARWDAFDGVAAATGREQTTVNGVGALAWGGGGSLPGAVALGSWHLACIVVAADGTRTIYLDGVQVGTGDASPYASWGLAIGASWTGDEPLDGGVRAAGIAKVAMTATDIASLAAYSRSKWGTA